MSNLENQKFMDSIKEGILYVAKIVDDQTNEVLVEISSFTEEGLEEEMGKSKWTGAIQRYADLKMAEREAEAESELEGDTEIPAEKVEEHNKEMGF